MGELKSVIGAVAMMALIVLVSPAFCLFMMSIFVYAIEGTVDLSALDAAWKLGAFSLPFFAVHWWAWRE